MDDQWRYLTCTRCQGGGTVFEFALPVDCRSCKGNGVIWIRPTGHIFEYPGGPALGVLPPRYYEKAIELITYPCPVCHTEIEIPGTEPYPKRCWEYLQGEVDCVECESHLYFAVDEDYDMNYWFFWELL